MSPATPTGLNIALFYSLHFAKAVRGGSSDQTPLFQLFHCFTLVLFYSALSWPEENRVIHHSYRFGGNVRVKSALLDSVSTVASLD